MKDQKMAARKKKKLDFEDEGAVLAEVAKALDEDPEDLLIDEDSGLSGFGEGTVYEISAGRRSWKVAENHDQFEKIALEVVKQDLENEPEIFNKDFIERHINTDRLRRDLESDVNNSITEDLTDTAERDPDQFWKDYEREGFDAPEEDEDGERPDPGDSEIEELAEAMTKDRLKDPMAYLEEIYGDDAAKQAIEIAGIDTDEAADEAISEDGAEHFPCHYDGNYKETPSGFVYWRDN